MYDHLRLILLLLIAIILTNLLIIAKIAVDEFAMRVSLLSPKNIANICDFVVKNVTKKPNLTSASKIQLGISLTIKQYAMI